MPFLPDLAPFPRRAAALALHRMLAGPRFDVCAVRQALAAAGLAAPRARVEALRAVHCTPFADLPDGFRDDVATETLALFGADGDAPTLDDLADAAGLARAPHSETQRPGTSHAATPGTAAALSPLILA